MHTYRYWKFRKITKLQRIKYDALMHYFMGGHTSYPSQGKIDG